MQDLVTKPIDLIEHLSSKGFDVSTIDGYKVINKYSSIENEINSLYSGVGLRNISHYGIIELKGKDVLDFLHRISTNSIIELSKAQTAITLFTSDKGRIIGMGRLINFEDYQLFVCDRESKSKVMSWIKKYIITDDVQVNDANEKYNLLELMGPQADSFIQLICGNVVNEIEPNTFKIIQSEDLLFFLIKLSDDRGGNKFWLLSDTANSKRLINNMLEYDGPYEFNLVGENAYNEYRIEQGIPVAPNELNDNYNPHEANLMKYIDTEKGCYIGQEVIERLNTYEKVQKYLVGVEFNGQLNEDEQFSLFNDSGNNVGTITSSINSTKLDMPIGLAYVRKAYTEKGTELIAKSAGGNELAVTVCTLPFIK